jgi:hypothetical protein
MPRARSRRKRTPQASKRENIALTAPPSRLGQAGVVVNDPQFGETKRTPDPVQFLHAVTDAQYHKEVDKESANQLIQRIPPPRDPNNLLLALSEGYGSQGNAKVNAITDSKQIVFHAVGDTGPTRGPRTVEEVADKMAGA